MTRLLRRHPRHRLLVAAGVAVVLAVGVPLATASWLAGGTGTGSAKAGTSSALTLGDASASVAAQLYPGATGDVRLSITNPNPFPVQLTAISATGAITSDKGAACDAATGVTFTAPSDLSGAAYLIAAGATTTATVAGSAAMSNASDNACQGATFSIPVSVTGRSA